MIDCREDIRRAHRELLQLIGTQREVSLPTDEEIEAAVSVLIDRTGVDILNVPLELDLAKSSFAKIRRKQPPSHNRQQFADGVIWAHCLELLDEADVCLVTSDKAFFEGNIAKKGNLASNLDQEARGRRNQLALYSTLETLMTDIRVDVTPDHDDLIAEARQLGDAEICALLEEHQFSLGPAEVLECDAFFTETPDQLYVQVTVCWQPLFDETLDERSDARLLVVAEGKFLTSGTFSEGRLESVEINYTDKAGSPVDSKRVFAYLSSSMSLGGPAIERHTLRANTQGNSPDSARV